MNNFLHSRFSPSKLPRIITCPGSVIETEHVEQESSSYAQEGTMLHSVTEECLTLNEHTVPEATKKKFSLTNVDSRPLVDAVQEVLDWVSALRLQYADYPDAYEVVEQQVSLASYEKMTGCELLSDVAGTLDYAFIIPSLKTIYVVDWKFGAGVEVYPDNEQAKAYTLGKMATLKFTPKQIYMVIGQPRLYSGELFKTEETSVEALTNWLKQDLVPALNNSLSRRPIFNPTNRGCMFCAIKKTCKHRKNKSMEAAANVFKLHAKLPDKTDEEELAEFLYQLPDLKKYIADIELYAINKLKGGICVPGWKLVAGRSIRKWKDEQKAKEFYYHWSEENDMEPEDFQEVKFKTPPQVEKFIGKKNITKEMETLIIKPEGKPTLVKESDKRPALEFESAEQKFKKFIKN